MTTTSSPIRRIVVPLDGSPRAARGLTVARELAPRLDATIAVLRVVPGPDRVDAAREALRVEVIDAGGSPETDVVAVAADDVPGAIVTDDATVCLATDGHGHGAHTLLGSVATGVIRMSRAPVLLAGPRVAAAPPTRVVACLDGSRFAEHALPVAHALATQLDVPLVVVQVVEEAGPGGALDVPESGYVEHQARGLEGEVSWEVLHGDDAASAIGAWIGDDPGTVVVLASHGRSGFSQLVLGSVAAGVIRAATGPVLVVPAAE